MPTDPVVPVLLSAPALALVTIELIKLFIKRVILKDPDHDFPPVFFVTFIPVLTGAWGYLLAYIGWGEPVGFDLMTLVQWFLASLIEVGLYALGVQPLKDYAKTYRANNS